MKHRQVLPQLRVHSLVRRDDVALEAPPTISGYAHLESADALELVLSNALMPVAPVVRLLRQSEEQAHLEIEQLIEQVGRELTHVPPERDQGVGPTPGEVLDGRRGLREVDF